MEVQRTGTFAGYRTKYFGALHLRDRLGYPGYYKYLAALPLSTLKIAQNFKRNGCGKAVTRQPVTR